jgi:hypothetical protein
LQLGCMRTRCDRDGLRGEPSQPVLSRSNTVNLFEGADRRVFRTVALLFSKLADGNVSLIELLNCNTDTPAWALAQADCACRRINAGRDLIAGVVRYRAIPKAPHSSPVAFGSSLSLASVFPINSFKGSVLLPGALRRQ